MDAHFHGLDLQSMDPISRTSSEWLTLQQYIRDTHGSTHSFRGTANIQQAFRVERKDELENWTKAGYDSLGEGERMLLWHGSRSTNFGGLNVNFFRELMLITILAGILKEGLRIAPPQAPVTGSS
jgi:poly [ADP-ribose] polymerase